MGPAFEEGTPFFLAVIHTQQGLSMLLDLPRIIDIHLSARDSELLQGRESSTREMPEAGP